MVSNVRSLYMDEIIKIEYQEITLDRLREQFRKYGYIAVPLSEDIGCQSTISSNITEKCALTPFTGKHVRENEGENSILE